MGMGKLEVESRKRRKRDELSKIILNTVALVGFIGIAAIAPKVASLVGEHVLRSSRSIEYANRARDRLLKKGLLTKDAKGYIRITAAGERKLRVLTLDAPLRPLRWDGKWRILIFDIPNERKGLRDKVRQQLMGIGFVMVQRSVWVYPYNCEDLVALLKADLHVGKDLLYIIADSIENDRMLKKEFGLK